MCPIPLRPFVLGPAGLPAIPSPGVEAPAPSHLSRGVRQRIARRRWEQQSLSALVDSVNSLCGTSGSSAEVESDASRSFIARARLAVEERAAEERSENISVQEAVSALLKSKAGYTDCSVVDTGGLASYEPGNVSLPDDTRGSPLLRDVCSSKTSDFLDDIALMLNSEGEGEAAGDARQPQLYMDPVLANNVGRKGGHYHAFIRDLARRGLVRFTRRKLGGVTVFFVRKKTGQLRMIIDARVVNKDFKRSPPVHMCSPEILADLECAADDVVYSATIDIKDCFHRLRLDDSLSDYFCLPGGTAASFGLTQKDGFMPDDIVYPACSCLPMGFSWSVFFAQDVATEMVRRSGAFTSADEIRDGYADTLLNRDRFFCYVDNIGVLGKDAAAVDVALNAIKDVLLQNGLLTHDHVTATTCQDILGIELDGKMHRTRVTTKRYCRIRAVLRWLLGRKRTTGQVLEVIMGHLTYASMVYRPALAIFFSLQIHSCFLHYTVPDVEERYLGAHYLLQHHATATV